MDNSQIIVFRSGRSHRTSLLNCMKKSQADLKVRKSFLFRMLPSSFGKFKSYIRRTSGFRPTFIKERGIETRVKKSRYNYLLMKNLSVKPSSFDEKLLSATKTLVTPTKTTLNMEKLYSAALRVLTQIAPKKRYKPLSIKNAALLLNSRSSSGFPFTGRKGKNIKAITKMAFIMKKRNLNGIFKLYPNMCAFRLQLRGMAPKISIKYRVMYPYPAAITLLEQTFVFPVITQFSKCVGSTFYTLGMRGKDTSDWLKTRKQPFKDEEIISLDVDAYDQNMCNEVLICAFWILRQMFILTKTESELYWNICYHSIMSYHAMKYKGKPCMFVKNHGIPSGSSFTNLIGTMCHAVIMEYIFPDILSDKRILLCSDDNIFVCKKGSLSYITDMYRLFGLDVSTTKTSIFRNWTNVEFLGYKWINYLRHINLSLAINQIVYHTQFITDLTVFERELARAASVLLTGVNGQKVFRELFPDVIKNLERGEDIRFRYLYGYGNPVVNSASY